MCNCLHGRGGGGRPDSDRVHGRSSLPGRCKYTASRQSKLFVDDVVHRAGWRGYGGEPLTTTCWQRVAGSRRHVQHGHAGPLHTASLHCKDQVVHCGLEASPLVSDAPIRARETVVQVVSVPTSCGRPGVFGFLSLYAEQFTSTHGGAYN